jgi:DNA-binding transcriptional LysR family regulator
MPMAINSLYLEAFYTCSQMGNFTRAAERLHITQSALSQRIKNLESDLGATLLVREKKGVRLTEFGERLVQYCRAKESAEKDLMVYIDSPKSQALSGIIRIGTFSSVARSVVLPALSDLLRANPKVQLKLLVRELYDLESLLKSGEIDFLITTSELERSSVLSQKLGNETNVLIQKKGYKGPDVFLDHDEEDTTTVKYLGKKAGKFPRHFLDDIYGIIDGVQLGLGRAVVPRHLIRDKKDIEIVNPTKTLLIPVFLHCYEQPFYSKLHEAVVQALTNAREDIFY